MRRKLEFKNKIDVIISNKRLDKDEFITDSLFQFSKKNEYEIHLLEEILKNLKDNNKLLQKIVEEPKESLKNKVLDSLDDGK